MPSQFEQQFASAVAAPLRDTFGTANSTYTGPDKVTFASGLTVRVQRSDARQVDRPNRTQGEMQTADLIVLQADMLFAPQRGGAFAVTGQAGIERWTIETSPLSENGQWICKCSWSGLERANPRKMRE